MAAILQPPSLPGLWALLKWTRMSCQLVENGDVILQGETMVLRSRYTSRRRRGLWWRQHGMLRNITERFRACRLRIRLRIDDPESMHVFSEFRTARSFRLRIQFRLVRFRQSKACGGSIRILIRSATYQPASMHCLGFDFTDWFAPFFQYLFWAVFCS